MHTQGGREDSKPAKFVQIRTLWIPIGMAFRLTPVPGVTFVFCFIFCLVACIPWLTGQVPGTADAASLIPETSTQAFNVSDGPAYNVLVNPAMNANDENSRGKPPLGLATGSGLSQLAAQCLWSQLAALTCTPFPDKRRRYAEYRTDYGRSSLITGAEALIECQPANWLCDSIDQETPPISVAFVSVERFREKDEIWERPGRHDAYYVQFGYGKHQLLDGSEHDAYYFEVQGDSTFRAWGRTYIDRPGPLPGSQHHFKIELNPASGVWYAFLDTLFYDSATYSLPSDTSCAVWRSFRGNRTRFGAEVSHQECDMVGTADAPTKFFDRQVRMGVAAGVTDSSVTHGVQHSDDRNRWHIDSLGSRSAIAVWD